MLVHNYLNAMVEKEASDLYLTVGAPPSVKIHGKLQQLNDTKLTSEDLTKCLDTVLEEEQLQSFQKSLELNLAFSLNGVGRFRINVFQQRNQPSIVIRHIKTVIPTTEELGLPPVLKDLVMEKNGLLLLVGATGTGKSTSLASMINYRNENSHGHIVTIEDPVEFMHRHKQCIVNQREVGVDTHSYHDALANTLRQAPDAILIGEIRTIETMQYAIAFSETGHLCLSTLHANSANQTLERIINFFPKDSKEQILLDLSLNIRGIISQRLIPTIDGKRVAAFEILIGTPLIRDLIKRGNISEIKEIMEKSESMGMKTFDSSLYDLYQAGIISEEEALRNADSKNNLRLRIQLSTGSTSDGTGVLSIDDPDELGAPFIKEPPPPPPLPKSR